GGFVDSDDGSDPDADDEGSFARAGHATGALKSTFFFSRNKADGDAGDARAGPAGQEPAEAQRGSAALAAGRAGRRFSAASDALDEAVAESSSYEQLPCRVMKELSLGVLPTSAAARRVAVTPLCPETAAALLWLCRAALDGFTSSGELGGAAALAQAMCWFSVAGSPTGPPPAGAASASVAGAVGLGEEQRGEERGGPLGEVCGSIESGGSKLFSSAGCRLLGYARRTRPASGAGPASPGSGFGHAVTGGELAGGSPGAERELWVGGGGSGGGGACDAAGLVDGQPDRTLDQAVIDSTRRALSAIWELVGNPEWPDLPAEASRRGAPSGAPPAVEAAAGAAGPSAADPEPELPVSSAPVEAAAACHRDESGSVASKLREAALAELASRLCRETVAFASARFGISGRLLARLARSASSGAFRAPSAPDAAPAGRRADAARRRGASLGAAVSWPEDASDAAQLSEGSPSIGGPRHGDDGEADEGSSEGSRGSGQGRSSSNFEDGSAGSQAELDSDDVTDAAPGIEPPAHHFTVSSALPAEPCLEATGPESTSPAPEGRPAAGGSWEAPRLGETALRSAAHPSPLDAAVAFSPPAARPRRPVWPAGGRGSGAPPSRRESDSSEAPEPRLGRASGRAAGGSRAPHRLCSVVLRAVPDKDSAGPARGAASGSGTRSRAASSGHELAPFPSAGEGAEPAAPPTPAPALTSLAVSADEALLASGSVAGEVRLWRRTAGALYAPAGSVAPHPAPRRRGAALPSVSRLLISPSGVLVSCSDGGDVAVMAVRNADEALAPLPRGSRRERLGGAGGAAAPVDNRPLSRVEVVSRLAGLEGGVVRDAVIAPLASNSVAAADGHDALVAMSGSAGRVTLHALPSASHIEAGRAGVGGLLGRFRAGRGAAADRRLEGHSDTAEVDCVALDVAAGTVASGGRDGRLCAWEVESGEPIALAQHGSAVLAVAMTSPWLLAAGTLGGEVTLQDLRARRRALWLPVGAGPVWAVAAAAAHSGLGGAGARPGSGSGWGGGSATYASSTSLIAGCEDGKAREIDLRVGARAWEAAHAGGRVPAAGTGVVRTFGSHAGPVTALAVDGTKVVTGSADTTLRMYASGGGAAEVSSVILRRRMVFTASWDGDVRAWFLGR
ncbi:unnamed protein product, partial [Symbiodinium sp. KB8]